MAALCTLDYTPYGEMELERGAVVDGADALRLMDERQWPPPRGVVWERYTSVVISAWYKL